MQEIWSVLESSFINMLPNTFKYQNIWMLAIRISDIRFIINGLVTYNSCSKKDEELQNETLRDVYSEYF